MSKPDAATIAEVVEALERIERRLNATHSPKLTPETLHAINVRANAKARGYYLADEFAQVINRPRHWVSARCRVGAIKTLPGPKPFRIRPSEESKFLEVSA